MRQDKQFICVVGEDSALYIDSVGAKSMVLDTPMLPTQVLGIIQSSDIEYNVSSVFVDGEGVVVSQDMHGLEVYLREPQTDMLVVKIAEFDRSEDLEMLIKLIKDDLDNGKTLKGILKWMRIIDTTEVRADTEEFLSLSSLIPADDLSQEDIEWINNLNINW